jgi:hypothetical protein
VAATEQINVIVGLEAARIFKNASPEQCLKLELLISLQLRSSTQAPTRSRTELMDEIGRKVQERGLTPEILVEILAEG